jgi:ribosomal protein L11 methyltransferase
VQVARDNARLNRAGADIAFVHARGAGARALRARAPYDLIFANILLSPLKRMAAPLARLLARRGRLILSGLLNEHVNAALASYRALGLTLERRHVLEGWTTLVLRRRA